MNNTHKEQMVEDMHELMRDRVSKAIRDTASAFHAVGGVPTRDILETAASILLCELVRTVTAVRCDEEDFVALCRTGWRALSEEFIKQYEEEG